ncbi:MAG: hypothetical protein FLDDKLPJ_01239 [Phycisphaerae bacterium]|nr:hypothetical protein [Phycisphaerae bacterium]
MNTRFADTQYYVALLNRNDQHHARAMHLTEMFRGIVVTSEWVLAEVGSAMSAPRHRSNFARLLGVLRARQSVTIVPATSDQFQRGMRLYSDRPDKAWSLVDCISFEVMEELHVREALTADHHFEQAGFVALLK